MRDLVSDEDLERTIERAPFALVQFGSDGCAPCHAIRAKIDAWHPAHPEVDALYVDIDRYPRVSAQHGVLGVPTIFLYIDGRRHLEARGYFSLEELFAKTERYLSLRS
ncbi:MAG: thioredoxin family protein [Olsenella sp.]|nr:thioredoxin family protein [Olsenella sp.]